MDQDIYRGSPQQPQVFGGKKNFGQNFDTRRIFYEKLIFSLVGKGRKMTLDVEKCDFSENSYLIHPISWIRPKIVHRQLF